MEHISAELLSAVVTAVGGLGVSGLTRAWILHRTRSQIARERAPRATG